MQRGRNDRSTRVLTFGLDRNHFDVWRTRLKNDLREARRESWAIEANACGAIDEAIAYIEGRNDLEIVFLGGDISVQSEHVLEDCERIARALSAHKYKPWVCFDHGLEFLIPAFDKAGVTVAFSRLDKAVFQRWSSQVIKDGIT